MESDQQPQPDYDHPVAYDADGKPLYSHPPEHDKVNVRTDDTPYEQLTPSSKVTDANEIRRRHKQSRMQYPTVSIGSDEFIVAVVYRHPIGMFGPLSLGVFLITLALVVLFNYDLVASSLRLTGVMASPVVILVPVLLFIVAITIGMYVIYHVYMSNILYLTNNNIVQQIKTALFSEREQIVGLANIEDVSYSQNGIIQQIFDYGSIQLTIEGYGAVYKFENAANPRKYMVIFDETIENFQNHSPHRK